LGSFNGSRLGSAKFLPLYHKDKTRMLFIPKSYMTAAEFRDAMFKKQLRTETEFWPTTLQRENEGIYFRIVAGPGSKSCSAAIGNKIRVLSLSQTWRECTVIDSASKRLKVTYDDFSSDFDEWIDESSDRLSKESLESLEKNQSHEASAADMTVTASDGHTICSDAFCFLCNPSSKNKDEYGEEFRFSWGSASTISFGSDAFECDVALTKDKNIDSKHACLTFEAGRDNQSDKYVLCDVSTGNNLKLENVPCQPGEGYTVESGQSFTIGDTTINISFAPPNRNNGRYYLPTLRVGGTIWPKHEFNHGAEVRCVSFLGKGKLIVSGDDNGDIIIRRTATGNIVKKYTNDTSCSSISISSDGNLIASGQEDGSVVVREIKTGKVMTGFQHTKNVRSLSFLPTPNGLLIAAVSTQKKSTSTV
jgi:WD40 repeat protein